MAETFVDLEMPRDNGTRMVIDQPIEEDVNGDYPNIDLTPEQTIREYLYRSEVPNAMRLARDYPGLPTYILDRIAIAGARVGNIYAIDYAFQLGAQDLGGVLQAAVEGDQIGILERFARETDQEKNRLLDLAIGGKHRQIVEWLLSNFNFSVPALSFLAGKYGYLNILPRVDYDFRRVAEGAAMAGNEDLLSQAIKQGAQNFNSMIRHAESGGRPELARAIAQLAGRDYQSAAPVVSRDD